eukprot:COSAG02_NODE_3885_length_6087_cov_7.811456_5_plen_99_part_00
MCAKGIASSRPDAAGAIEDGRVATWSSWAAATCASSQPILSTRVGRSIHSSHRTMPSGGEVHCALAYLPRVDKGHTRTYKAAEGVIKAEFLEKAIKRE